MTPLETAFPVPARKPRVMIVGHQVGRMVFGAERSLLGILAALNPHRYDVSCAFPQGDGEYLRAVAKHTKRITVFPYRWWTKARPSDPVSVSRFERLFRREQIDLVHVNTITLMDPLLAARRLGVPSLVHARELIDRDERLAGMIDEDPSVIVRTIQAASDFIIANSDETHRLYGQEGRSFRLYNSVDTDRFDLPNELEPGKLKIGIISSNEPNKGIKGFVDLAILASRDRPELEFFVIGPRTAYVDWLESDLRGRGLPVKLSFLDYVEDPVDAVRQVNVVVSLSVVAESFGRTIAEAMAARRPVVAYRWGAAPEIIRHGTDGFLIPFNDVPKALEYLGALADHPGCVLEMGRNARERAERLFSPDVFASQLDGIYREILQTRNVSSP